MYLKYSCAFEKCTSFVWRTSFLSKTRVFWANVFKSLQLLDLFSCCSALLPLGAVMVVLEHASCSRRFILQEENNKRKSRERVYIVSAFSWGTRTREPLSVSVEVLSFPSPSFTSSGGSCLWGCYHRPCWGSGCKDLYYQPACSSSYTLLF